jgi:glycosyltransferase involved in cell wall biosynthesis
MKIAFITRTVFGALGTSASYMLPSHANEEHEVLVLSPNDPESGETVVYQNPDLNVIDTYHPNRQQHLACIAHALINFRPDVIHLFFHKTCHQYPVMLRHLFPNASWIVDFRSPLMIFQKGHQSRMMLRWKSFFLQFFVDRITATSKHILKTHLPLRLKPYSKLPFGIDISAFSNPKTSGLTKEGAKRFVFAGNIAKARRLPLLIKGFKTFLHQSNTEALLDIYGAGNGMNELYRTIQNENLEYVVNLKGHLQQPILFKKLCTYDIGIAYVPNQQLNVAPSLKALEFAAAGLPVVASDTLGHREIATKDGMQLIFFKNKIQDLADSLHQLYMNGISQESIFTNLRAVSRFDWRLIVEKDLLPVYESVMKMKSRDS